ncbi:hypothetical protein ACFLU5_06905 [Bacteroidota bacterium]
MQRARGGVEVRSSKLEGGRWKLEGGRWKVEGGSRMLEATRWT